MIQRSPERSSSAGLRLLARGRHVASRQNASATCECPTAPTRGFISSMQTSAARSRGRTPRPGRAGSRDTARARWASSCGSSRSGTRAAPSRCSPRPACGHGGVHREIGDVELVDHDQVVVADQAEVTRSPSRARRTRRAGRRTDKVAEAPDARPRPRADPSQHRLERGEVAVHVGEQGDAVACQSLGNATLMYRAAGRVSSQPSLPPRRPRSSSARGAGSSSRPRRRERLLQPRRAGAGAGLPRPAAAARRWTGWRSAGARWRGAAPAAARRRALERAAPAGAGRCGRRRGHRGWCSCVVRLPLDASRTSAPWTWGSPPRTGGRGSATWRRPAHRGGFAAGGAAIAVALCAASRGWWVPGSVVVVGRAP